MKKILYIISVILLLSLTSCPIYMDINYSFNFENASNDTIVVASEIISIHEGEDSSFTFTECIERTVWPGDRVEIGSANKIDISRILKPHQLWYFMIYTKEIQREFEYPEKIFKKKKYLQLFAIDSSFPDYGVAFPPTKIIQEYAVVLDPPSGYYNDPNETK